jgi:hypothetical protein
VWKEQRRRSGGKGNVSHLDHTEPRTGADAQQPLLVPRSGCWARLTASVRLQAKLRRRMSSFLAIGVKWATYGLSFSTDARKGVGDREGDHSHQSCGEEASLRSTSRQTDR